MYLCICFIIANSFYSKTQEYIRNLIDLGVKIVDQICVDVKMKGHGWTISKNNTNNNFRVKIL